jgi:hypothetical protein
MQDARRNHPYSVSWGIVAGSGQRINRDRLRDHNRPIILLVLYRMFAINAPSHPDTSLIAPKYIFKRKGRRRTKLNN